MKKTASVVGAIFGVSILCIGFLAIVSPHYAYDPQKYVYVGRYIGELFGGSTIPNHRGNHRSRNHSSHQTP